MEIDYERIMSDILKGREFDAFLPKPLEKEDRQALVVFLRAIPEGQIRISSRNMFLKTPDLPQGISSLNPRFKSVLLDKVEPAPDFDYTPSRLSAVAIDNEALKLVANAPEMWLDCYKEVEKTNPYIAEGAIDALRKENPVQLTTGISASNARFMGVAQLGFLRVAAAGVLVDQSFTEKGKLSPVYSAIWEVAKGFDAPAKDFEDFVDRMKIIFPPVITTNDFSAAFNVLGRKNSFGHTNEKTEHDCIGQYQTKLVYEEYGKLWQDPIYINDRRTNLLRQAA